MGHSQPQKSRETSDKIWLGGRKWQETEEETSSAAGAEAPETGQAVSGSWAPASSPSAGAPATGRCPPCGCSTVLGRFLNSLVQINL